MINNPSTSRILSAALLCSVIAQKASFIFDGTSFTGRADDFGGIASIFRLDDIKDGKNFTLRWGGDSDVEIIRLDLMIVEGHSQTLASRCLDNSCTSTTGFYLASNGGDVRVFDITLESELTRQLAQVLNVLLCFRIDWQLNNGGDKTSSWSQEWSVVQDAEDLIVVFQSHQPSITAGASPVSPTGPAPTSVPNALFNTASPGNTVSTTTASNSIAPTETAREKTSNTRTKEAWIAGPVVGGIAAICLFLLGVFLYQRRRRRRAAALPELEGDTFQRTGDKPQLHSEHLPPRNLHEMDASHAPCEADDGALPEMAANEVPQELEADDHHLRPSQDGIDGVNRVVTSGDPDKHQNAQYTGAEINR